MLTSHQIQTLQFIVKLAMDTAESVGRSEAYAEEHGWVPNPVFMERYEKAKRDLNEYIRTLGQ